jgi:thiol-disulfide isomerase/thioredoxin
VADAVARPTLVLCAAALAILLAPAARGADVPAPKVGGPAPALGMTDLDGKRLDLAAYRGKVVVVDFWATWCAPCRSQAPRYVQMQSKYREKGLVVLGISLDESPEPVREFQGELKVKYRLALGDDEVAKRWGGILGLPSRSSSTAADDCGRGASVRATSPPWRRTSSASSGRSSGTERGPPETPRRRSSIAAAGPVSRARTVQVAPPPLGTSTRWPRFRPGVQSG